MSESNMRNKPCPCGSGKKFKRCCMGRKPITQSVLIDFGQQMTMDRVEITPNGEIRVMHQSKILRPESAWTMFSRERNKGEKILRRIPIDPYRLYNTGQRALLDYDVVIAIDTNTRVINGDKVSISACAQCRFRPVLNMIMGYTSYIGFFIFYNSTVKEENLAWYLLQRCIQTSDDYKPTSKYAIISDSDLGRHTDYNTRRASYVMGKYLPDNFQIVYASDDGCEYVNKVMRMCDKEAGTGLDHISRGGLGSKAPPAPKYLPCSRLQIVANGNEQLTRQGWFRLGFPPETGSTPLSQGD